jgi:hypothetical protein
LGEGKSGNIPLVSMMSMWWEGSLELRVCLSDSGVRIIGVAAGEVEDGVEVDGSESPWDIGVLEEEV